MRKVAIGHNATNMWLAGLRGWAGPAERPRPSGERVRKITMAY
jgi:hypothetical protein